MTRFRSLFCVVASAILIAGAASAARPRYGGVLRVQTQAVLRTLDPAASVSSPLERATRQRVLPLVFEQLIDIAPDGGLRPGLAASWSGDSAGTRWQIRLRPGVVLHDGTLLTPERVAASLALARSEWQVAVNGETIDIIPPQPVADLPWELTELRTAVALRTPAGGFLGTGAFRVEALAGNRLTLRAHEQHRDGRPFLDGIQIEMGRATSVQLSDLELGRADLVDVAPIDAARLTQRQLRVSSSRPIELIALLFEAHRATSASEAVRRAFAGAINRNALSRVVLQGRAEPAETLLPSWLSGYPSFVVADPASVSPRLAVTALPAAAKSLIIRVDASDTVGRAVTERVAVDARAAGFSVTVQAPAGLAPRPDLRLVRLRLEPSSPDRTLSRLFGGLPPRTLPLLTRDAPPPPGAALQVVSRIERSLLENSVLVPLVHLPDMYGVGMHVDTMGASIILPTGAWDLASVWTEPERPLP